MCKWLHLSHIKHDPHGQIYRPCKGLPTTLGNHSRAALAFRGFLNG